jgi:calcium-dependent protein kinase
MWKELSNDGLPYVSKDEMKQFLKDQGNVMDGAEFDKMFNEIDLNKDGRICYSEFLASGIGMENTLTDESLEEAFKLLDLDGVGELDADSFGAFFEILNFEEGGPWANLMAAMDITNFLDQGDKDGDKKISLDEFKNAIKT